LELQNTIIENQQYVIAELMKLYCIEPTFKLDEKLQEVIRQNNQLIKVLDTP